MSRHHTSLTIRDRQEAAKNLMLQYRIERASKWAGRAGLVILGVGILSMIIKPL